MKGSVLIPFFYFYLSRFTSSTYKGSYILSIVYYCILCHRLDNHLDSIFFSESSICSIGMYPHFFFFFLPRFLFLFFFFFCTSFILCAVLQFLLQTEIRKPDSSRPVYSFHNSMAFQGLLHFPTSCLKKKKKKEKKSSSVKNDIGNVKEIALNL